MGKSKIFWSPRLVGARYETHSIPLDILKDFVALESLIIEVAKYEFKKKNARHRAPRKFSNQISIQLSGVKPGSARPVLTLAILPGLLWSPVEPAYERARDSIIATINQAANGEIITAIPQNLLHLFDKIGRSLKDDECIEFAPKRKQKAIYNQKIRERILKASSEPELISNEVSLRGRVFSCDIASKVFGFEPLGSGKILSHIPVNFDRQLIAALAHSEDGGYVFIEGMGTYKYGKLATIEEISHISHLDEMDTSIRLAEIAKLKDGWLDGQGVHVDTRLIAWLENGFDEKYPSNLVLPFLYPTPEGGLLAEWRLGANEISLEIEPDSHNGRVHVLNLKTDEDDEFLLDLDADGWDRLAEFISSKVGNNA